MNFARTRSFTRRIGLFALLVASAAGLALSSERLFRDNAGAVTADFGQRLEGELQELDRDTKGRLIVAIFAAPEGDVEEFASRTAAGWERAEPKLEDGAILFYFTKTQQARVWTGAGLAARLPSGALDKRLTGIFRGPAAFVTYPDSIEKSVRLFSAEIRNALEASQPRSAVGKLKWKIGAGAGVAYFLAGLGILLYLLYSVVSLLRSWYRTVGETIAAGERKHETAGQIALDVGKEAGIGAAKIAAGLALEAAGDAIGGGASGGGGGFSGGGGSFGGGGASGSW